MSYLTLCLEEKFKTEFRLAVLPPVKEEVDHCKDKQTDYVIMKVEAGNLKEETRNKTTVLVIVLRCNSTPPK